MVCLGEEAPRSRHLPLGTGTGVTRLANAGDQLVLMTEVDGLDLADILQSTDVLASFVAEGALPRNLAAIGRLAAKDLLTGYSDRLTAYVGDTGDYFTPAANAGNLMFRVEPGADGLRVVSPGALVAVDNAPFEDEGDWAAAGLASPALRAAQVAAAVRCLGDLDGAAEHVWAALGDAIDQTGAGSDARAVFGHDDQACLGWLREGLVEGRRQLGACALLDPVTLGATVAGDAALIGLVNARLEALRGP